MADDQEFWNRTFDDADAPGAAHADRAEPTERARAVPRDAFAVRPRGIVERMLDRAREWRSDGRFGVVMLIVVAVVAGAVWYRIGIGGGSQAGAASSSASPATRTTRPATTTTTGTRAAGRLAPRRAAARRGIAVHVAGAVTHPGVVELGAGTRVVDAVEAVGGAHADADLDRLNLAAKLADGQRIYVPKVGEADPGALGGGDAAPGPAAPPATVRRSAASSTSTPPRRPSSRRSRGSAPPTRSRSSPSGSAGAASRR